MDFKKAGRPKASKEEKRDKKILLKLTVAEYDYKIKRKALSLLVILFGLEFSTTQLFSRFNQRNS